MKEKIENIRSIQPHLVSENIDAASFTDIDAEVLAAHSPPSHAEIEAELLEKDDVSNDNNDEMETENKLDYCPDRKELLQIIETIQIFSLFSNNGALVQTCSNYLTRIIDQHVVEKSMFKLIDVQICACSN